MPISYNIAPSQKVLTIRFNPEIQQRSLDALQWGLIPYWVKDPKIAYPSIRHIGPKTSVKRYLALGHSQSGASVQDRSDTFQTG